jgi:hypothetical protein
VLKDAAFVSLVYPQSNSATDLTYTVEQSANLVDWTVATPTNEILSDDGATKVIKAQVPINNAPKLFLRLPVSR